MTTSDKPKPVPAPETFGDFGQDDVFATESHPEGLRYDDAAPVEPGSLPHPELKRKQKAPTQDEASEPPDISIG